MGTGRYVALGAVIAALAGLLGYEVFRPAAPDPPETETSAASQAALRVVTWDTLAHDLRSTDPTLKAAAMQFVGQAHYRKRETLRKVMDEVSDPAVKASIGRKLDAIYAALMTNPPEISLHVKDANLREVMDALNEEMGTHIRWNGGSGNGGGSYTLDAEGKSLWEVILELGQQGNFAVIPFTEVTFSYSSRKVGAHQIAGPFFMYASASDIKPVTQPPSFMVNYTVVADPRLPIMELKVGEGNRPSSGGSAELGPDSAGNVLKHLNGGSVQGSASYGYSGGLQTYWPEKPGTTITFLKTKVAVTTYIPVSAMSVDAIDEKPGWQGKLGEATLRVPQAVETVTNGPLTEFSLSCVVEPPSLGEMMVFHLYNRDDQMRWAQRGAPGGVTASVRGPSQRPWRLVATQGKNLAELTAVLEIRDLPMPPR